MKNKIFSYTKDRSLLVNILTCIFVFISMFIMPTIFASLLHLFIKSVKVCTILGDILYILLLYLIYFKDLNNEAKIYFKDFKNKFKHSFKLYILGYGLMIFFNLIIVMFLKNISSNEEQVREMLYNNVMYSMIMISLTAPITEELVFRKSLQPVLKSKWIYSLICGLLFGFAHILTNISNGIFVITDLLYIFPYASLGVAFGLMDYENKTTFSSIVIHSMHNTITAIMLLVTYFGGK